MNTKPTPKSRWVHSNVVCRNTRWNIHSVECQSTEWRFEWRSCNPPLLTSVNCPEALWLLAKTTCFLATCWFNCSFAVLYLKLEDVSKRFQHPCLMDIKVGPITYDHEADTAKIMREKTKSPALPQVGFQIVGMRVSVTDLQIVCVSK